MRVKPSIVGAAHAGLLVCLSLQPSWAGAPYGLPSRVATTPYFNMPQTADGALPATLSQTGLYENTASLKMRAGLIPYELVVPFWSDGAQKTRHVSVPGKVAFAPTGEWKFPAGSLFVKTFDLAVDAAHPAQRRRLETRILVRDRNGGVYGADYKWRADLSDADLLPGSQTEEIKIRDAQGMEHTQTWYYPSREDCQTCHTARAGGVLGLKTRQMNHSMRYPDGVEDNELRAWNHAGLFEPRVDEAAIAGFARLAPADDAGRSLEDRARSYLDANCSHCHQPGGTVANFDARYDTPLAQQNLIDGDVLIDQGIDRPRIIAPHDVSRSIAYMRASTNEDIRMPPLARETVDTHGVALLAEWIRSLPGRDVLEPPQISPMGGTFAVESVKVTLSEAVPGADIHFTLDGSAPTQKDPKFEGPITLTGPTVLRARAYKGGYTRSIAVQQTFLVGK